MAKEGGTVEACVRCGDPAYVDDECYPFCSPECREEHSIAYYESGAYLEADVNYEDYMMGEG